MTLSMRRVAALGILAIAVLALSASGSAQAPSPPSGSEQSRPAKHTAKLAWHAPPAEDGNPVKTYNVYRTPASLKKGAIKCGKDWHKIGSTEAPTTAFTDQEIVAGKAYCYAVTSVTARGESPRSVVAAAIIPKP